MNATVMEFIKRRRLDERTVREFLFQLDLLAKKGGVKFKPGRPIYREALMAARKKMVGPIDKAVLKI